LSEKQIPRPDPADRDAAELRDVVAIDGPSGAGKSTVARALAARLGCVYLDTGAMYRAVTWFLLERELADLDDPVAVAEALEELDLVLDAAGRVRLCGRDVSGHLRSHEVESRVSAVSALPEVRRRMRALQRDVARRGRLVAEGRDVATIVFPAARWKFYLDAGAEERARRRRRDFLAAGRDVSPEEVLEEIVVRDRLDSTRKDAPLRRAADACYVDTSGQTVEAVVERLAAVVESAGGAACGDDRGASGARR
jgi:cytidylate kinase